MGQSLSQIYLHIIFSTKDRKRFISKEINTELYNYLGRVFIGLKCPALSIGGTEDHIHILCKLNKTMSVSALIEKAKTSTSKWLKTKGNDYKDFYWQSGYGVFSVSQSQIPLVSNYISNQEKHHKKSSFKSELRAFLKKYELEYDEMYIWT